MYFFISLGNKNALTIDEEKIRPRANNPLDLPDKGAREEEEEI